MTEFAEWESFYLIVGGAAGALIGLQFVVMTLIHTRVHVADPVVGRAFATPTIVHFCIALFLSALVRAPFQSMKSVAVLWGIVGIVGFAYCTFIGRSIREQNSYKPEFEDWLFHMLLPLSSYLILVVSAIAVLLEYHNALFAVGTSALVLLFVGIHNAWDAVTYHVFVLPTDKASESDVGEGDAD
ncbi:MAG: hypothetical protein DMF63_15965 [Acidobacteria bacterium]|nr:MAG: hypothetical protein DMF63_15965 [Acidobacteriota bacterium]